MPEYCRVSRDVLHHTSLPQRSWLAPGDEDEVKQLGPSIGSFRSNENGHKKLAKLLSCVLQSSVWNFLATTHKRPQATTLWGENKEYRNFTFAWSVIHFLKFCWLVRLRFHYDLFVRSFVFIFNSLGPPKTTKIRSRFLSSPLDSPKRMHIAFNAFSSIQIINTAVKIMKKKYICR